MKALLLLLAAALATLPCAAGIDVVHKTRLPDKRPELHRERFTANFDNCSLFAEYTLSGNEIVNRRWGDRFFGLRLGYSPKNGGWSIWDFLDVYVKTPKGLVNVPARARPTLFTGYSAGGADFLAAEWTTPSGGRLKLRFASYPSYRDWLFVRIDLGGAGVERIDLNAYPGNAAVPEGRERRFATAEGDWHLNREPVAFKPVSPAAMLYSRYVDDRFGNKLVFDDKAIASVSVPKTRSKVTVRLTPAEKAAAATFALGYFAHKEPSDQLTRFLGEDADAVAGFLRAIDWEPEPDPDEFKRSVKIALSMDVDRDKLKTIARRYLEASKTRDFDALAECAGKVRALRKEKASEELNRLR